jgi:hypothetical protein
MDVCHSLDLAVGINLWTYLIIWVTVILGHGILGVPRLGVGVLGVLYLILGVLKA